VIFLGNALNLFPRVFEVPLPRNAQKRTKDMYLKKGRYVRALFCELAQMYVVFPVFFSAALWAHETSPWQMLTQLAADRTAEDELPAPCICAKLA
jgi:hypothetical protein